MTRGRLATATISVSVSDDQNDRPVDVDRWCHLVEQVLDAEGVHGPAEFSLSFVDEAAISELNQQYMNSAGPTDVLSFPIDEEADPPVGEGSPPRMLGDVVICPSVAAANAPNHAGSYEDEIALLVVHGVLHVLGLDHADDAETATMQGRERELLATLYGPLSGDPWAGST